jgi:lycopene cyclase domain-containing protein
LNSHYTYFIILAASLAGPLALSFDKKVAFYKKWKYLFPAMVLPALFYIVWDSYFTYKGIWSFNALYNAGIYLYNLPVEEILFFIIVPYCCVFIYECIRCYFPNAKDKKGADIFLKTLAVILLIAGIVFYQKQYSSWTFIFNALFIFILYAGRKYFTHFDAASFLISYAICLIPFLIVNGFLTALPVITYNHNENFNTRIYTIPFEDTFYGMLLVLMNVVIYEKLKNKN